MLENKELYSYLVSSVNIINKSLLLNEQNTVKLFSYLYNNYSNDTLRVSDLENCIVKINSNFENIYKEINDIHKDINNIKVNISNEIIATPVILIQSDITKYEKCIKYFKKIINNSKNKLIELYHKIYKKIYYFIFKKKMNKNKS
jgi:hypothetical protein